VITHVGAGTTMAVGYGVPLLRLPMGRDQFSTPNRVCTLGAGRMLMPDADSDAITEHRASAKLKDLE
jgi:UDP:flavonoid glycosyltransferase YjiC (YdhE family)